MINFIILDLECLLGCTSNNKINKVKTDKFNFIDIQNCQGQSLKIERDIYIIWDFCK